MAGFQFAEFCDDVDIDNFKIDAEEAFRRAGGDLSTMSETTTIFLNGLKAFYATCDE